MGAMSARTVVITGPTSGIGREIARGLARLGARLVLGCRDTAVWLASDSELAGVSGKLFENRAEIPCAFRRLQAEEQLWSSCQGFDT